MSSEPRPEDRIICATLVAGMFLCTNCSGDTVEGGDASSTVATTVAATTDEDETGEAPTGENPDPDELPAPSCAGDVYVGRRTDGGTCGDFIGDQGSWVGASLGTEGVLAAFCEYRWTPDANAEPDLSALPGPTDDVVSLAELCPRVIPQAGYFTGDGPLRGLIAAEFMANIGKPSVPMPADRAPVDVRLIDTMPDGLLEKGLTPRSHHGLILRRLAEDMLCTAGDCRASVGNHLGLPRLDEYEVDTERGGFFGNLVELAWGIDEGLEDSEADEPNARRVLVLALGWDGVEDYGAAGVADAAVSDVVLDPEVPADLQFVIASLARASCHGALAVAAAGNSTAEPCTQTGPTGPGFLEALPAPDAVACDALGFDHTGVDLGEEHPLVLAATHVTPAGERPANARQGAQATLVAQGAMFGDPDGADEMLRGSSVAATVIGATAAWVWSYYPKLTPAQVRQALYTAGTALPGEPAADFPHPAASRQTSICGALIAACELSGTDCAGLPACTPAPGADPAIAAHLQNRLEEPCQGDPGCTMPHAMILGPDFPSNGQTPSACGGDITTWPESDLPPLAPLPPLPWTIPQPGATLCPTCFVAVPPDGPGIKVGLDFIIDVELPEQLFIHVETSTGTYRIAIPVDQLMTDRANIIEITPPIDWGEVWRVELGYVFKGLGGALQYRSEPLASFDYPCADALDECYMPGVGDSQQSVGACKPGTSLCTADGWTCEGGGAPTPEDCSTSDIDEDCDGSTGCCGDGVVSDGEECDDGNLENLDGCENDCELSIVQIETGWYHSSVLLADGSLRSWGGENAAGGLGYGNYDNIGDDPGEMPPPDVEVGSPVKQVSIGAFGTTCVVLDNKQLKCWGFNQSGQLGYGDTINRGGISKPVDFPPVEVGAQVERVSVGAFHVCALLSGGLVKCWGDNPYGELGQGHTDDVGDDEAPASLPPVPLPSPAVDVQAGDRSTCALLSTGVVQCWGNNNVGQLGYGHTNNIGDDEMVAGVVDVGEKVAALAMGGAHTCVLLDSGKVRCWGFNDLGQLGTGSTENIGDDESPSSQPPVEIGDGVVDLRAGHNSTYVLHPDGSMRCWGYCFGHGLPPNIGDDPGEMPPPKLILESPVIRFNIGRMSHHVCAQSQTGRLYCWGDGPSGALGYPFQEPLGDAPDEMPPKLTTDVF